MLFLRDSLGSIEAPTHRTATIFDMLDGMKINPEAPRFELEPTSTGFRVLIPTKKNWFVIPFMIVWLGGWLVGEHSALTELMHPKMGPPLAFLGVWLIGWTLGGFAAFFTLIWQLVGREIIAVDNGYLVHRVELLGLAKSREYRGDQVCRLRAVDYSPGFNRQASWMPPFFGSGNGPIAFDFGAKSIRLGQSLNEAEAPILVDKIASFLPKAVQSS